MKVKNTHFFRATQRSSRSILKSIYISGVLPLHILFFMLAGLLISGCKTNKSLPKETSETKQQIGNLTIVPGAFQIGKYINLLKGKPIAVVANQTSILVAGNKQTHLIDTLLALHTNIKKVFSPEHGFRGTADAGEQVLNGIDVKTGLPLISLYGSHKKPTKEDLKGIKLIIFDLQDVGVRFYTYISTLHYVMEAAAENRIPLLLLDRPNPNAHYIDGPVLEDKFRSFIGMHPVPVVYGMSIGEYAQMINGEGWLRNGLHCDLNIIKILNYSHKKPYTLPVKPSPNLPNNRAVNLYPSLCFFEGTNISCGRGTDKQFQQFGAPELPKETYPYSFIPLPNKGAKHPKHQGKICYGVNLENQLFLQEINLQWLLNAYYNYPDKPAFFNSFFNKLAGTNRLQNQIKLGYKQADIKKTWQPGLEKFKKIRSKYLLYQ